MQARFLIILVVLGALALVPLSAFSQASNNDQPSDPITKHNASDADADELNDLMEDRLGESFEGESVTATLISVDEPSDLGASDQLIAQTAKTLARLRRIRIQLEIPEFAELSQVLYMLTAASGIPISAGVAAEDNELPAMDVEASVETLLNYICHYTEMTWVAHGEMVLLAYGRDSLQLSCLWRSYDLRHLVVSAVQLDPAFDQDLLRAIRARLEHEQEQEQASGADESEDSKDPASSDGKADPAEHESSLDKQHKQQQAERTISRDDLESIRVEALDMVWERISEAISESALDMLGASISTDGKGHFYVALLPHDHVILEDALKALESSRAGSSSERSDGDETNE